MQFDNSTVLKLNMIFHYKWVEISSKSNTDRKNRSAIWNKYVKTYELKPIAVEYKKGQKVLSAHNLFHKLIDIINYENDDVSNSIIISNPDRHGQYFLIKRDIAERILVFGMI